MTTAYTALSIASRGKNVGPIRYCEPFYIVIHQVSLLPPLSHAACASMSTTTTTTTTTTRDRGDRYGMGPMTIKQLINGGVNPYGTGPGGHVLRNIYEGGTYMMSFRLGVFYPVTATTVVCCILMKILCVICLLYTSPSPRDRTRSRMPSSA